VTPLTPAALTPYPGLAALAQAIDRDGVRSLDDALAMAAAIVDPNTGDVEWLMAHGCDVIDQLLAHVRRLTAALADSDARVASAVAAERARCAAVCRDIASDATDDDPVSETADACAEAIERASAPTGGAQ